MIPTLDGSQPEARSPKVSEFVADFIARLKEARQPSPGERAMSGAVGQSIKDNPQYYA